MNQDLRDRLCRAIHNTLRKNTGKDPISVTEKIVDAVELLMDIETEDSGIGSVPDALQEDQPWDIERNKPAPKIEPPPLPKRAVVPASKSTLILPGDADFKNPIPAKSNIGHGKVQSVGIVRRGKPAANVPEAQYWDDNTLNEAIMANTPTSVEFEVEGPRGPVKIRADRNTHVQIGLGTVLLTYKHPLAADSDGSVTVSLTAHKPFSVYQKELDFEDAMYGPSGIMVQLRGIYRYREGTIQPSVGPDPGPLRLDMRTQPGDSYEDRFQSGAGMVENPLETVRRGVTSSNAALAPAGKRF